MRNEVASLLSANLLQAFLPSRLHVGHQDREKQIRSPEGTTQLSHTRRQAQEGDQVLLASKMETEKPWKPHLLAAYTASPGVGLVPA